LPKQQNVARVKTPPAKQTPDARAKHLKGNALAETEEIVALRGQ
jgi:hypothetical protein